MTETDTATSSATPETPAPAKKSSNAERQRAVLPVLEQLFETCPNLFGAEFLPLKLGVFQEILAAYPDRFKKDTLRAALGVHTRSTRYLQAVATGKWRHDLAGTAVEPVAPEHVFASILELFRRRQMRQKVDLRPQVVQQIIAAVEASGLSRQDYEVRVQTTDTQALEILSAALDAVDQTLARQVATARAFGASGKSLQEFADMYGLDAGDVGRALERLAPKAPPESGV
jgi:sRNA-binding protein